MYLIIYKIFHLSHSKIYSEVMHMHLYNFSPDKFSDSKVRKPSQLSRTCTGNAPRVTINFATFISAVSLDIRWLISAGWGQFGCPANTSLSGDGGSFQNSFHLRLFLIQLEMVNVPIVKVLTFPRAIEDNVLLKTFCEYEKNKCGTVFFDVQNPLPSKTDAVRFLFNF